MDGKELIMSKSNGEDQPLMDEDDVTHEMDARDLEGGLPKSKLQSLGMEKVRRN